MRIYSFPLASGNETEMSHQIRCTSSLGLGDDVFVCALDTGFFSVAASLVGMGVLSARNNRLDSPRMKLARLRVYNAWGLSHHQQVFRTMKEVGALTDLHTCRTVRGKNAADQRVAKMTNLRADRKIQVAIRTTSFSARQV